ncbi:MAG: hypothetical protein K2L20_07855 [Ligilactobacillus sp.]|nr:hypothetical protein [Ligilactobacillus sp.]
MKYQVFVCADLRFEADMGNLVKLWVMIQADQNHAKLQLGEIFDPYALLKHIIKEQCLYGIYILATNVLNGDKTCSKDQLESHHMQSLAIQCRFYAVKARLALRYLASLTTFG